MSTAAVYADISRKRLLGTEDFRDRIVDYMRTLIQESMERSYPSGAAHDSQIDIASGGNDKITVGSGTQYATDGLGHVLALHESSYMTAQFENAVAVDYSVLLHFAEVPDGVQVNPRSGQPEYIGEREEVGFDAAPTSVAVVGGGTQLEFVVDPVTESGVSNAGRTVAVWKLIPGDNATTEAVAVQYLTVTWDGSNNRITTADLMGQSSPSTTAADYRVCLLGPTIKRNGSWDADTAGYAFIGTVTGVGAGSPPSSFDMSNQRVALATLDDLADVTSRHGTTDRLKIDVKSYAGDSSDEQIAVRDTGGAIVFSVDGDGNMIVQGTQSIYDTVTIYSSENITDNLSAGDAASDSHLIKGTWRHTDPTETENYFRVDGTTGHIGINALPDATAWLKVCGSVIARHITPETTGDYDLGTASLEWRNFYVQTLTLSGDLDPASDGGPDMGDRSLRWNAVWAEYGNYPNNAAGYTALSPTVGGIELSSQSMDTSSQYTTALKLMSTDAAFTTQTPKLLGAIAGRATENYAADTDGGMAIDFFTTPNNPGASGNLTRTLQLDENGKLHVTQGTPDIASGRVSKRLDVEYNPATLASNAIGGTVQCTINAYSSGGATGLIGASAIDATTGTILWTEGVFGETVMRSGSSCNLTWAVGVSGWVGNHGSGVLADGHALHAYNAANDGGGTYVRQVGLYVEDMQAGGTNYGVYIEGASTAALWIDDGDVELGPGFVAMTATGATPWDALKMQLSDIQTALPSNNAAFTASAEVTGYGAGTNYGVWGMATKNTAASGTASYAYVIWAEYDANHGGTITDCDVFAGGVYKNGGGTITNGTTFRVWEGANAGGGVFTNQFGLYVDDLQCATNNYGVYVKGASTYALWIDSGDTRLDGRLSVNTTGPTDTGAIYVDANASVFSYALYAKANVDTDEAGIHGAVWGYCNVDCGSGETAADLRGVYSVLDKDGAGNIGAWYGVRAYADVSGGSTTSLQCFNAGGTIASSTSVGTYYGYRASGPSNSGTLTTSYGVRVENLTQAATNYGVWIGGANPGTALHVDSGDTVLKGPVGIDAGAPYDEASLYAARVCTSTSDEVVLRAVAQMNAVATGTPTAVTGEVDCNITSGTDSIAYAISAFLDKDGAGTLTTYRGVQSASNQAGGTIAGLHLFRAWPTVASGSCTTAIGYLYDAATVTGTLTNQYGLYVANLTSASSGNYGIRILGASPGYAIYIDSGLTAMGGDLRLFGADATVTLKAGGSGTTGKLRFSFNTDSTDYGDLSLPYDTCSTLGLILHSAYPITYNAVNFHAWQEATAETMRLGGKRLHVGDAANAGASWGTGTSELNLYSQNSANCGIWFHNDSEDYRVFTDGSDGAFKIRNENDAWNPLIVTTIAGRMQISDYGTSTQVAIGKTPDSTGVLQINLATADVGFVNAANSGGTTGQGYIQVNVGGSTRYIRLESSS